MSKKVWLVPVIWHMYGIYEIEADTLEQAKEIALTSDDPLPPGEYIEDSLETDDDESIERLNKKYE